MHCLLLLQYVTETLQNAVAWAFTLRYSYDNTKCYLSNISEGKYKKWKKNFNPGVALIGLSGTGSKSWTNLKMIKTDRSGSLAVQPYSFIFFFYLKMAIPIPHSPAQVTDRFCFCFPILGLIQWNIYKCNLEV